MDNRLFFPAIQKNKDSISEVLSRFLLKRGSVLEIGSGSGEHGVVFQKRFPEITWQLSDPELIHRNSISSWIEYENLNFKMPQPLAIDVEKNPWEIPYALRISLQAIISINMIHISSWNCTKSLFKESQDLLRQGKFIMLYGPFKIGNKHVSKSNDLFDMSLKKQNKYWGVRDIRKVSEIAENYGFLEEELIKMPNNNFSVIYRKLSVKSNF